MNVFLYTYDEVVQWIDSLGERRIGARLNLQVRPAGSTVVDEHETVEWRVQRKCVVRVRATYKSSWTDPRLRPSDFSFALVIRWNRCAVVFTYIKIDSNLVSVTLSWNWKCVTEPSV